MTRAAAGEAPRASATREDGPPRKRRDNVRSDLATYRIAVGKRHKVGPGAIVGAIANEGGLHRSDFGHITIKMDHSLVELPAKLSQGDAEEARAHPYLGCADQPGARPGGSRRAAAPPQVEVTLRRDSTPWADSNRSAGRVASLTGIRAVAATPGGAHPRGVHHRQVHPRLCRAAVLPHGDRRADLLRAVRLPVVLAVGAGRRRPEARRRRCAATPGTGCGASCPPTSSRCWRPTRSTTSARRGRIPATPGWGCSAT